MNLLNKIIRQIAFILVLVFSISATYGQLNKTVGTRITDVTTEKELKVNAILDLESTSKGFFLPRMTTLQRDAIKKEMGKDNGLAVYNIDNDCVEYWSERADKWMSLCGSLPPAKLDLGENSCESIKFIGFGDPIEGKPLIQQGVALNAETHMMTVELKVNQIGTYTISVNSHNGYFFSGEGQFQAVGTYTIILKGMGTPIKGYDQTSTVRGDKLEFTINGILSKVCNNVEVNVKPADLDFTIRQATYAAQGKYNVGKASSKENGNVINLNIDVASGGLATITAINTELGLKFTNTKNITALDNVFVLEPVLGENTPMLNDKELYNFKFEVNTKDQLKTINGSSAQVIVEKTQIKAIFKDVNLGKEPYYQGNNVTEKHTIELPLKVINSGKTNLYLKGSNLEFIAENVMLTMPTNVEDTQIVKFIGVKGVLPNEETVNLLLSGDNDKRFEVIDGNTLSLPIEKKPVAYTIDCSSVKTNRTAMPHNKEIGTSYYIIAEVDVTVPGEYEINTSAPVDGVIFSTSVKGIKKVFTKTGKQPVELYAIDETVIPKNKGEYSTNLVANDMSASSCLNIKLKVGYGEVNILIIRYASNNEIAEEGESLFFSGKNSNGKSRFGEDGVYAETGDVKITTWNMTRASWASESAKYANEINSDKYNFIIISSENTWMSIDDHLGQTLINYVKKDGVLVYTLPGIYGIQGTEDYLKVLGNMNGSNSVMGQKSNGGMILLKFLVGADRLPMTSYKGDTYFTSNVVDQNHFLSKPKFKVNYIIKSGDIYQDVYWYSIDATYRGGLDVSKTDIVSLVADRGAKYKDTRGTLLSHKTYSNVIIAPIISNWYSSPMKIGDHIDKTTGEPYANGYDYGGNYRVTTQSGLFTANVYIGLIERVANK